MRNVLYNCSLALSVFLLFLASISIWVFIPLPAFFSKIPSAGLGIETFYAFITFVIACVLLFQILLKKKWRSFVVCYFPYFLIFLLIFPFFYQTINSSAVAHATWLKAQHENLTWLGGDIYTSQEYVKYDFKNRLFVVDSSREIAVFSLPTLNSEIFTLGIVNELLKWFGYSSYFCEFINRGFVYSLLGCLSILLLSLRDKELFDIAAAAKVFRKTFFLTTIVGSFVFFYICTVAFVVSRAEADARRGDYRSATSKLRLSKKLLPLVAHNTSFIFQKGLLDLKLKRKSNAERLFRAKNLIDANLNAQALPILIELSSVGFAIGRESRRLITKIGIDGLNSNNLNKSISLMESVVRLDSTSLKANYALQLAYLRVGNHAGLEELFKLQKKVYSYFNAPSKKVVIASSYENLAFSSYKNANIDDALSYWQSRGKGK